MKRFFKLSLFLLMALLPSVTADAHDFIVDGIYYKRLFNNEVEVTYLGTDYWSHGDRYQGDITIPETITYNHKTYTVTSLGDNAFYGCSDLTSISIPRLMSMATAKSPHQRRHRPHRLPADRHLEVNFYSTVNPDASISG